MSGTNKITTAPSLKRAKIYIESQIAGLPKGKSAELAGFAKSTQRSPDVIEKSNSYAIMLRLTSEQNAMSLHKLATKISEDISEGEMGAKTLMKTQIMKNIAHIEDMLTPKVTLKESTDQHGNKTKTTQWGSAGAFKETVNAVS